MPNKILIVDDDRDFVSTMRQRLVFEGYSVITASDGDEGVELFEKEKPGVVVLDFFMPKLNGYAFLKMLQGRYGKLNCGIIVCTGRADVMDSIKSEGISGFLVKPFDPFELVKMVRVIYQFFSETPDAWPEPKGEAVKPKVLTEIVKEIPVKPHTEFKTKSFVAEPDRPKILIIDDEIDFIESLKTRLEFEGYEVMCAYNGQEGLNVARLNRPDMVLLDIMMPIVTGHMVCRLFKRSKKLSSIPIIMMTGRSHDEDRELSLASGAEGFVTKPVDFELLFKEINKHLPKISDN